MTLDSPRLRLGILGIIVMSLFAALFARLWYLQVLASPTYRVEAQHNSVRVITTEAPRGRILDRQGRVLVDNRVTSAVVVTRDQLSKHPEVLDRLSGVLGVSADDLRKRAADVRFSPYKPVPVAEDVPKEKIVYIKEHQEDFPGVDAVPLSERVYPQGALAAHVLGYIGAINDKELASRKGKGYTSTDTLGKAGVELSSESDLRGQPQVEKLEVDSRGHVVRTLDFRPPVRGHDVQLTVDLDVQKLTEESLAEGLAAVRRRFVGNAGAAVVLDPRDGSVLAMASYPTYDPTQFVNGIPGDVFRALQDPAGYFPLTNRAIQGLYAPGSTFKLITSIAGLERGVITPSTIVNDTGSVRIADRTFRNAFGRAFGPIDVSKAIAVSSDVFFYNLGGELWNRRAQAPNAMQEVARGLGLGDYTHVELPYEADGRVPDPDLRRRLHEANPKGFPRGDWFIGDNVNLAVGQGELVVTPLQLANAYATFANGGTVFAPRVTDRVLDVEQHLVRKTEPRQLHRIDIPPAVRTPVLQGLVGATTDPKGTATPAFGGFPPGFPVAGKTGTAEVFGKQDTALFVSFAPADNPQYVVAVVMEESGFGAEAAAPVARRILEGLAGSPPKPVSLSSGTD